MLDERELLTFARGAAGALVAIGPTLHHQVIAMLRGLDLSDDDAHDAIRLGIARRILIEEGGTLRAGDG